MALTLRTDEELEHALTALAKSEGTSRQDVIRKAVLERYARDERERRISDSSQRMMQRWGETLDRLGSV